MPAKSSSKTIILEDAQSLFSADIFHLTPKEVQNGSHNIELVSKWVIHIAMLVWLRQCSTQYMIMHCHTLMLYFVICFSTVTYMQEGSQELNQYCNI